MRESEWERQTDRDRQENSQTERERRSEKIGYVRDEIHAYTSFYDDSLSYICHEIILYIHIHFVSVI